MKKYLIILMIAAIATIPASSKAFDIGQAIGSGIGAIQQVAEASKDVTPSEEHYIGRAIAATLVVQTPVLNNPNLTRYINEVGQLVAAASDRPDTFGGYHFAVLNSDEINAFACPGGFIFVNKGLLKNLKSEDELAGVLGHEIAHVAHRHGIKAVKKQKWTNLGFYVAGEVGKQYSSSEAMQIVSQFQDVVTDIAKQVITSGYSQSDEKDADRSGMDFAYKAGYDAEGTLNFFKILEEKGIGTSSGPFSSHPKSSTRIKALEKEMSELGDSGEVAPVRITRFKAAMAGLK